MRGDNGKLLANVQSLCCREDFVNLVGPTVNEESFPNSMMGDSAETNDFDLDGALLSHFDQLDADGQDTKLDRFQPPGSSRNKAFRASNFNQDENIANVRILSWRSGHRLAAQMASVSFRTSWGPPLRLGVKTDR